MHRFHRILACTDFSEPGDRAVEMAFGLCQDADCTVTLLHVVDLPQPPNPLYAHYVPNEAIDHSTLQDIEAKARAALGERVPAVAAAMGLTVSYAVPQGDAAQCIVEAAKAANAEVIVMGTRGRSGLETLLLGSVADRVLRTSRCAVLVVH